MRSILIILAVVMGGSACGSDRVIATGPDGEVPIPDRPTYIEDVAPILERYCVECHGTTTTQSEARNCVRLDRWDSVPDSMQLCSDTATGGLIFGVRDAGPMLVDNTSTRRMPLGDRVLTDREIEILERWRDAGFPKRATNQPSTIQFVTPPSSGVTVCEPSCLYGVEYIASDPDDDSITWSLTWSGAGTSGTFATGIPGGSGTLTIDAGTLGSGTYMLAAKLDDGTDVATVEAPGAVTVPAGHNAGPTVTVVGPNGGESYYDNQPITVTWIGTDADNATLTYDVVAVGSSTIAIQTITAPVGQSQIEWTPPTVMALTSFRIQVTAQDGGDPALSSIDESDADFVISPPPQAVSFSGQLQPLFEANCTSAQCHDAMFPASGLQLTAGASYNALVDIAATEAPCTSYKRVAPGQPDQSYLVFKLQGSGACFSGSRMPKAMPALTSAELQLIRDWIANGAPNN